jgi:uncharacterized Fe-S cluster-containing radical SAM superfamily enzyme
MPKKEMLSSFCFEYPNVFPHLVALVKTIKQHTTVPISISCQTPNGGNIQRLAEASADRIGLHIDAATEKRELSSFAPTQWSAIFLKSSPRLEKL